MNLFLSFVLPRLCLCSARSARWAGEVRCLWLVENHPCAISCSRVVFSFFSPCARELLDFSELLLSHGAMQKLKIENVL